MESVCEISSSYVIGNKISDNNIKGGFDETDIGCVIMEAAFRTFCISVLFSSGIFLWFHSSFHQEKV